MTLRDVCRQVKQDAVGSLNYADMPLDVFARTPKSKAGSRSTAIVSSHVWSPIQI